LNIDVLKKEQGKVEGKKTLEKRNAHKLKHENTVSLSSSFTLSYTMSETKLNSEKSRKRYVTWGRGDDRKTKPKNSNRAGIFARFLSDTFGGGGGGGGDARRGARGLCRLAESEPDCTGVFDVAGGSGDLAFQLETLRGVQTTVIDPREKLSLDRSIKRYQIYQRNCLVGAQFAVAREFPHLAPELAAEDARLRAEKAKKRAKLNQISTDNKVNGGDSEAKEEAAEAAEAATEAADQNATVGTTTTVAPATPSDQPAPSTASTCASTVPDAKLDFVQLVLPHIKWFHGMCCTLAVEPVVDMTWVDPRVWAYLQKHKKMARYPGHMCMRFPTDKQVTRIEYSAQRDAENGNTEKMDALDSKLVDCVEKLKKSALIAGMHADGATEPLIDFALRFNKPFAVVPCCVFYKQFAPRYLPDGTLVKMYDEFIEYLCLKDPRIKKAELPFQGRNIVLYGNVPETTGPVPVPVPVPVSVPDDAPTISTNE
jgi:hypothetical protein